MPNWNPDEYLRFANERTRPCRDLAAAIQIPQNAQVIDLGCGPGNSTKVLADRWPTAEITGLDSSESMIDAAKREQPLRRWVLRDIAEWAAHERMEFDLVFSNAALQWLPDHASLFPKLLERAGSKGALAVQMPAAPDALPHRLMRELAPAGLQVRTWGAHEPAFYYDLLAPNAARVDIWRTEYQHVLPNADAILDWYKATGLRPFLEAITSPRARDEFLERYRERIGAAYPPQPDGKVLFPFRRLFIVAYPAGNRTESSTG
jgi:trans-aconitate 2-methyltransferase